MGKLDGFEAGVCVWRNEYCMRAVIDSERFRQLFDIAKDLQKHIVFNTGPLFCVSVYICVRMCV